MYGAIIGDLAGSIYEYDQTKQIKNIRVNNIIEDNSFYSDDTILTIAILDAIKNDRNYDKYLSYKPNFSPYFNSTFSPGLIKWANGKRDNNSTGNGAMMRISPVGYMFNTEEDVIENAYLATIPSHNSKEAIECATKIALIIYYLRNNLSLDEIYRILNINIRYKPFNKFNTTCYETIDNCLYVLYYSNSFEDAIRKIIYLGGDTDTNACIVGSMVEAKYGVNNNLVTLADSKIPSEFKRILKL